MRECYTLQDEVEFCVGHLWRGFSVLCYTLQDEVEFCVGHLSGGFSVSGSKDGLSIQNVLCTGQSCSWQNVPQYL